MKYVALSPVSRALSIAVLPAALFLGVTAAASAAPDYSANLTNVAGQSGPSPVFLSSSQDQSEGRHGEGTVSSGSVLTASLETSKGVSGFNNGIFTDYSANLAATYDDIFITGPPAASIPITLNLPFHASFTQSWNSLTLPDAGFTDFSSLGQSLELYTTLGSSSFGQSGEQFDLGLNDQNDTANIGIFSRDNNALPIHSSIQPGASPGPSSSETIGGITIFHNIPLDANGFLYLDRIQTPITSQPGIFGPGAGFHFDDIVTLHGKMVLPANAQVGVPLTLHSSLSIRSTASGGFQLESAGGIDAQHNFGVPLGGPVFDLPTGYTANSVSLGLVNNTVTSVAGDLTIKNDPSQTTISLGSVTTVNGSVDISGNTGATVIGLGSVTSVSGSVEISGNTSATAISLGSLTSVGGSVDIRDNGSAPVSLGSLTTVSGSVNIETTGTGVFGIGMGTVAGSADITANGYSEVDAITAAGQTDVTLVHGAATMEMVVPEGAFPVGDHVPFSVKELPADPVDSWGQDPMTTLAKYQFDFAITTLGQDATLNFQIDLAALDSDEKMALLNLLHANTLLTLAAQGDDPGAALQLFTVCGAGADPSSGCVAVRWLDENDQELLPFGAVDPSVLRFEALVGHFSTYSIVAVSVPEPATLVMLMMAAGWCLLPRRVM